MQPKADIEYSLEYEQGGLDRIPLVLDSETGEIIVDDDFIPPDWALLDHEKCSHCTLTSDQHLYCPIAKNLAFLFTHISSRESFHLVTLNVAVKHRSYSADTTVQRALGSLFGLICSLSPCPHTLILRPMGLFHLPISSDTETLVRAASFFVLRKYLEHLDNEEIAIDLSSMAKTFRELKILNNCFVHRLRDVQSSDAAVNAMILLDLLTREVDVELADQLPELKRVFNITGRNDGRNGDDSGAS